MSEKKMVEFKKGEMGFDLKLVDGHVRATLGLDTKGVDAGLYVDLTPEYFLEKLKGMIPGQVDDVVIDMLAKALKGIS